MNIDYRYLRPEKAKAQKKWDDDPEAVRDAPPLWQGSGALPLPLRGGFGLLFGKGGVVDEKGDYVALSAIPGRVEGGYDTENPEYRDEKVVYCGYIVNHWGHFLIEAVTRLWYFLENDPTIDKYVFFLDENEEREIKGNYRLFRARQISCPSLTGIPRQRSISAAASSKRASPLSLALILWTIFMKRTATPFSIPKRCRWIG